MSWSILNLTVERGVINNSDLCGFLDSGEKEEINRQGGNHELECLSRFLGGQLDVVLPIEHVKMEDIV